MVTLKKRKVSGKTYYYLGHTYRDGSKLKYKEIYLGNKIPKNIDRMKKDLMLEIYKKKWFVLFEKIKKGYSKELSVMPSEMKEKELENFAVKFTYDTNRIEGSKLSFKDTAELLEMGISPKNKPMSDIKEAEAHKKVFYEMLKSDKISLGIILKWHEELFGETKKGIAGKLREYQAYISGSEFTPPPAEAVQSYIIEFFKWYYNEKMNPVELAALAHLKFESIHPFGDGNGRIGRLVMNFILNYNKYPMLDIKYSDRRGYYNALERSSVKNNDAIFVQWFFKKYLKENNRYFKIH